MNKDQYKCHSYYDDDNILRDCTCGKCEVKIPMGVLEQLVIEVTDYGFNDEYGYYNDWADGVRPIIEKGLHQAIAEERERVRAKTKGVRDSLLVYFHNAVNDQKAPYRHAIQAIEEEILSSLPLTDKE